MWPRRCRRRRSRRPIAAPRSSRTRGRRCGRNASSATSSCRPSWTRCSSARARAPSRSSSRSSRRRRWPTSPPARRRSKASPDPIAGLFKPYVPRVLARHAGARGEASVHTLDASMVHVDVSGFTKLSERLAQIGPEGAEQLADAIGTCFASLLEVAYAEGGGLLKFGGDALLLLFDGEDHPARASRAAIRMRRRLRQVGRIETPRAAVQLRMTVGVHSGAVHVFVVGTSHRELLIAGPAATATLDAEEAARAGQVVVSGDTARQLPARCL